MCFKRRFMDVLKKCRYFGTAFAGEKGKQKGFSKRPGRSFFAGESDLVEGFSRREAGLKIFRIE